MKYPSFDRVLLPYYVLYNGRVGNTAPATSRVSIRRAIIFPVPGRWLLRIAVFLAFFLMTPLKCVNACDKKLWGVDTVDLVVEVVVVVVVV